jgi:hypothetical protein
MLISMAKMMNTNTVHIQKTEVGTAFIASAVEMNNQRLLH